MLWCCFHVVVYMRNEDTNVKILHSMNEFGANSHKLLYLVSQFWLLSVLFCWFCVGLLLCWCALVFKHICFCCSSRPNPVSMYFEWSFVCRWLFFCSFFFRPFASFFLYCLSFFFLSFWMALCVYAFHGFFRPTVNQLFTYTWRLLFVSLFSSLFYRRYISFHFGYYRF